jgi:hypothetical protein
MQQPHEILERVVRKKGLPLNAVETLKLFGGILYVPMRLGQTKEQARNAMQMDQGSFENRARSSSLLEKMWSQEGDDDDFPRSYCCTKDEATFFVSKAALKSQGSEEGMQCSLEKAVQVFSLKFPHALVSQGFAMDVGGWLDTVVQVPSPVIIRDGRKVKVRMGLLNCQSSSSSDLVDMGNDMTTAFLCGLVHEFSDRMVLARGYLPDVQMESGFVDLKTVMVVMDEDFFAVLSIGVLVKSEHSFDPTCKKMRREVHTVIIDVHVIYMHYTYFNHLYAIRYANDFFEGREADATWEPVPLETVWAEVGERCAAHDMPPGGGGEGGGQRSDPDGVD